MAIKIVIGSKDGSTVQKELDENQSNILEGKKIGDVIKGDDIGYEGYEFKVTGGSDSAGVPMRPDVEGSARKRILAVEGVGLKRKRKGQKQRKTVAGNTIHEKTAQVNVKVEKAGKAPLVEPPAEAAEGEAKPEGSEEKKE